MFSNLNSALLDFANEVVRLERRNLNLTGFARKGRKINNTKELSRGLGFQITENKTGFIVEFTSKVDYASFLDLGVNGTDINHRSPFSYKENTKFANIGEIMEWLKSPKVKLRKTIITKSGTKVSQIVPKTSENIKAQAFAIARKKVKVGAKPTKFFTEAINEAYDKLKPEAEKALMKDLEDMIFKDFQNNNNIKASKA